MIPLTLDAEMLSKSIRSKKKKLAESPPDIIDTSPTPDLDAQDIYDLEQNARIESTLMSPKKINANETMMNESYDGVGISPAEKPRMARLRAYLERLPLNW